MVAVCAIFEKVNFKIRQSNKNRMMTFTCKKCILSNLSYTIRDYN